MKRNTTPSEDASTRRHGNQNDMYTPLMIANTIVIRNSGRFDSMQLIKLVQEVQGWALAYGRRVCSEQPACWEHGPVHASLYEALRTLPGHDMAKRLFMPVRPLDADVAPHIPSSDHWTVSVLDQVIGLYGDFSRLQLSALLHREGTPWHSIYGRHVNLTGTLFGTLIDDEALKRWFDRLRRDAEDEEAAQASRLRA
jgi:uncharacterized phage-associated protein